MRHLKHVIGIVLLLSSFSIVGQSKYPQGGYLTFAELKSKIPSYAVPFTAERRDSASIFLTGGNDYKILCNVDSLKDENVKKKYFAIAIGDSLYINCLKLNLQRWYSILHPDTGFFYFLAAECTDTWSPLYVEKGDNIASLFGPIAAGVKAGNDALKRRLYTIDAETGEATVITNFYFERRCGKKHRDFFEHYIKDPDKYNPEVRLKYLRQLNKLD